MAISYTALSLCCNVSTSTLSNPWDRHDITEVLLKVALNTINQTKPDIYILYMPLVLASKINRSVNYQSV